MSLEEVVRKHCLKNAFDYGKADAKAIVGKVIAEDAGAKNDMKGTMALIAKIAAEVNALSKEQIETEMKNFTYPEKKEEEPKKILLPGAADGAVITRFAPEPNGYPHIGHAKAAFIEREAADNHHGKMLLRFDDTNPEAEKQEFVDAIVRELKMLGVKWDGEILYASDFMPQLYEQAERLIGEEGAYVCACSQDEMKKARAEGKGCKCRERNAADNIALWRKMLSAEASEGELVVRFKGDMQSLNTVMRDPYLFRVLKTPHYRQGSKYCVWPSYDFQAPVLDSLNGVTHAMRSKEYELRDELYFAVLGKLGLRKPLLIEFSRLAIKGAPISKRLLKPLIEEKKVMGWDDPRLPTLGALRRRGILPEAIRAFVLSFGLSKVESEPGWDGLLNENKKILNDVAPHLFFVKEPVAVNLQNAMPATITLRKHPTTDLGVRELKVGKELFIPKEDAEPLKSGELFRLKDFASCKLISRNEAGMLAEKLGEEVREGKRVQWVPKDSLKCETLVPHDLFVQGKFNESSLSMDVGLCEHDCVWLEPGAIVHFERYGFCRLDSNQGGILRFIFTCPL